MDDQESYANFNPADEPFGQREVDDYDSIYDALGLQPPPTTEDEWEDQLGMVVPLPDDVAQSIAEHLRRLQQQRMSLRPGGSVLSVASGGIELEPEDVYEPWQLAKLDMERMQMERSGIFPRVRPSFHCVGAS